MTSGPVTADAARAPGPLRAPAADPARAGPAPTSVLRGVHVLALVAIALAAVAVRATEVYASRYQSVPVLDWLESRPPLAESTNVPAAADLARGLARAMPLLVIRDDARTWLPAFGPAPAQFQRTVGGVRDASRIALGSPGDYRPMEQPIIATLSVIVFNRELRAAAWADLMGRAMDNVDPETGLPQSRVAGPDEHEAIWLVSPRSGGGVATVVGHRAVVGFVFQVRFRAAADAVADPAQRTDLSASAEVVARQAAADWSSWLEQQLAG